MIFHSSQLESVPLGGNVTLKCRSEVNINIDCWLKFHRSLFKAFPASINYWIREGGETVTSGGRYIDNVPNALVGCLELGYHRAEIYSIERKILVWW